MKFALAQVNPTIGDFEGNRRLILDAVGAAESRGAELVLFPELVICGYPPKDLLERPAFVEASRASLAALLTALGGAKAAALVGFPEPLVSPGRGLSNSAALIDGGRIVHVARKSLLPTYDVFDERRYFEPATQVAPFTFRGCRLGISICEDIWNDADFWPERLYRGDPIEGLVAAGAQVIVNLSASPYTMEKRHLRPRMLAATARRWGRPLLFVNQVGGQDDLVFDGASLVLDRTGAVVARAAEHTPDLIIAAVDTDGVASGEARPEEPSDERSALGALVLGTRDYARRCGFSRALLGLSGGIDSALVAAIAARALGPQNVLGVAMPSRYSSSGSLRDAEALARNLGIAFTTIPIEPMFATYLTALAPALDAFAPPAPAPASAAATDLTEQNLQARIRGAILMALSNRQDRLLLTTGNKSEIATGYCTLYGDMAGGLAVISDAPKTLVYRLARAVNAEQPVIPEATLTKPPSAELRPNQTDQDSLPPYDLLDAILEAHLVRGLDAPALATAGFDAAVARDVVRRVQQSEYKRRQMPPGLKITGKSFGPGRRYPIARA
ncbi:MAG TPA: NAD+ synthase [Polyangia bacterium]|nr:NAD+ synthase [Polyangia bacterium]